MAEQNHFEQLIVGMLSNDNEVRSMAEKEYEQIPIVQKGF
jgi:hypothetical protein